MKAFVIGYLLLLSAVLALNKVGSRKQPRPVAVLAGNSQQFHSYVRLMSRDERRKRVYVPEIPKDRSTVYERIETVGTFWDRDDADLLYDWVKARTWR